jgi:hypothetical protein
MVTAHSELSMQKIRALLGYRPRYDFQGAMRELAITLRDDASGDAAGAVSPPPPPP